MSVEIQVVEHKDCAHCYQPIDARATVCPHCGVAQRRRRRRYVPVVLIVAGIAALLVGGYLFVSGYREALAVATRLEGDLAETRAQLEESTSIGVELADALAEQRSSNEAVRRQQVRALAGDMQDLIRRALSVCTRQQDRRACRRVYADLEDVAVTYGYLLTRYRLTRSEFLICDSVRALLLELPHLLPSPHEAEFHDALYRATRSCWSS